MALPTRDTAWPPTEFAPAFGLMREHDAWYRGDVDALGSLYGSSGTQARIRPAQNAGGVIGAVARFFWGRPTPTGHARSKIHVPVAADIATTSADLLFSEPPRLILPGGTANRDGVVVENPTQDRLNKIFNDPSTQAELIEAAELSSALSGTYLRAVWDKDAMDRVMVDAVSADQAVPTWRWGQLVGVTFWTVLVRDGQRVLRYLERHEPGKVFHGLYEGTPEKLGSPRPLNEHEATAWAMTLVDAEGGIETGIEELTAAYIPNIRPQKRWRNDPALAPFGRSDFDGIEPIFDAIDEVYSSWMRDIRLAKARLIVPESFLAMGAAGEGASFDADQELFTGLSMLGKSGDGGTITPQQFNIRWQEHQETIKELTKVALRSAGFSVSSFGDDDGAAQETATRVKSKQQQSERTRDKKIRYWRAALGPFAFMLLKLDATVFGTPTVPQELPEVRFPEKSQQDVEEMARTAQALRNAEAASTVVLVRMLHPDWEADMVDAEVDRIQAERPGANASLVDPVTFRPTSGD